MMKKTLLVFPILWLITLCTVIAQDSLEDLLDAAAPQTDEPQFTKAVFKSSRLINGHSTERIAPGAMEFRIHHRFGPLNGGAYNLWGLDQAYIRFGFDFGLTDRLMIGVGRSSYEKTYDGFIKYAILRQGEGKGTSGVSMVYLGGVSINSLKWTSPDRDNQFSQRLSYVHQLLISRKFNSNFSLQLTPSIVHRNFVATTEDLNLFPVVGIGGRHKLSNRVAVTAEYFYRVPVGDADIAPNFQDYHNSFSLGVDIETGGHVFQLHVTNSIQMVEKGFITETAGQWGDGGIQFGFNIQRVFNLGKKGEKSW